MKNAERLKQRSFGVKFQSTLPRGARPAQDQANRAVSKSFNPRAHAGRDATSNTAATITAAFQSTRPRGARRRAARCRVYRGSVSIHAPTRGATARLAAKTTCCASFNPRAHAGRDTSIQTRVRRGTFQSTRPRGARPVTPQCNVSSASVSIHAPTRGATRHLPEIRAPGRVSIHAPTRGATVTQPLAAGFRVVSIHAPTRGATSAAGLVCMFPAFQSTRPRGARPRGTSAHGQGQAFQSTRPRGARRCARHKHRPWPCRFNPRAHAGRDCIRMSSRTADAGFNPRAHAGRDSSGRAAIIKSGWFQSTRPRGARPGFLFQPFTRQPVSIHAPTRGATPSRSTPSASFRSFNPRAHAGRDQTGAPRARW